MSESRKSDGELPKDGDNTINDGDNEFRNSRLSLSKDKASPDGAHEKLLAKEDEAKIVRVDMDAKYVCGDQRNGDPKIELDANKKQFSGLTKEELMKYADDPFWVRLRWFMFVLFWALWLGMLAGAIIIIVKAPKCAAPAPRSWPEKGPLAELDSQDYSEVEAKLHLLKTSQIQGVFLRAEAYDALDKPDVLDKLKKLVEKAQEFGVKVILDLTPNYVSSSHPWFVASLNNTAPFSDYFTWKVGAGFKDDKPEPINNWVSTLNTSAWSYSEERKSYYLHQFGEDQPDLNFNNPEVQGKFSEALKKWMSTGAGGVRLNKARLIMVNPAFPNEEAAVGRGADHDAGHTSYSFYRHQHTSDQPGLDTLLTGYAADVAKAAGEDKETVFTLKEEGSLPELYLLQRPNATMQRPPSAAPVSAVNATAAAANILRKLNHTKEGTPHLYWPFMQLKGDSEAADRELAYFAHLLPAAPIINIQLFNNASAEDISHVHKLRSDASVAHGQLALQAVAGRRDDNSTVQLLACARWKGGHTGYLAVFNPSDSSAVADLTPVPSVPATVSVYHVSPTVKELTNYTENVSEHADHVVVPGRSTVLLSYVPHTAAEN